MTAATSATPGAAPSPAAAPLVEMRDISVSFGGVHAVERVTVTLNPGEVVGLVGGNGAGKSTLMKALSGAHPPDSGEIRINGQPRTISNPRDAKKFNIECIYQTLALADNIDAPGNVFLGRELTTPWGTLDEGEMEDATRKVMGRLNPNFRNFAAPVMSMSGGQRQAVAIARAVLWGQKIVLLDEPAAALGVKQTEIVLQFVERLKRQSVGVIFISHNMQHVLRVADRIVVLRLGEKVYDGPKGSATASDIVAMITGVRFSIGVQA